MNKETIYAQIKSTETQIYNLQTQLSALPEGTIHITHQGKYFKWYYTPLQEEVHASDYYYIPKERREFASDLAVRKYLSMQVDELNLQLAKLRELEAIINNSSSNTLLADPAYEELLSNRKHSYTQEIQAWINADYPRNPYHPEKLIHTSVSGNILRSKSEALIDALLFYEGIPYRYECELVINGQVKYPDFTIIHPLTQKIIYWEHFGMMDVPQYARNSINKQLDYIEAGFIPNDNLICTYETASHPLTSDVVKKTIDKFLLQ